MTSKIIAEFPNIKPKKHYRNLQDGIVFSGKQLLNLLELARPTMQAILLLSIVETDEPVTNPDSKYGV